MHKRVKRLLVLKAVSRIINMSTSPSISTIRVTKVFSWHVVYVEACAAHRTWLNLRDHSKARITKKFICRGVWSSPLSMLLNKLEPCAYIFWSGDQSVGTSVSFLIVSSILLENRRHPTKVNGSKQAVLPWESKKRTCNHILTYTHNSDYTDNFARFGPALRT